MGTEVKLLSAACYLLSTTCNILNHSPPPISCAENKICRVDCTCACGKCVPFRRHFVPVGFVPQPNQHFILPTLQAYTSSPHGFGKYSFPFRKLIHSVFPKPFSNASSAVYIFFCGELAPKNQSPKGRAVSILHLIGALFRRTANTKIKPRKPLVFFIEG